jgi:predicted metal-dependent hydrolase
MQSSYSPMHKYLEHNNQTIDYTVRRSKRAKKARVTVYCDSSVVVTIPERSTEAYGDFFIRQNINWILSKLEYAKRYKVLIPSREEAQNYKLYKESALMLVEDRVKILNTLYGFTFGTVSVKNHKTKWGSCSTKGNLNFNYKIVFLPDRMVDYIIVHELCHLKEFNHSQSFWDLVSKTIPDFRSIREELRMRV